jgi:serine/threonine protein kinase/beta-lactam-binding protein with PASTA domain
VLRSELGRGGMATVHRAWDQVLDREVAVKLLHDHLAADPAFLDRFRREARAAAALSHPNVVGVHDWGETEQGAYLVLQLVDGPSLRDVLRARGRLTSAEALGVLQPAAAGLAAAHRAGLVHRDVKPENLLLGRDGLVRVTDFGLARAAASATTTFGTDVLVGSPHYLSPEAVLGQPLDPRADVYGLGIVLFECLTGRPPHEGDSPYATAVAHTTRPVPAPSTLLPGIPRAVDEVVAAATSIDRDHRHADGAAFAAAFAAAVPSGPVELRLDDDLDHDRRPAADDQPRYDDADGPDLHDPTFPDDDVHDDDPGDHIGDDPDGHGPGPGVHERQHTLVDPGADHGGDDPAERDTTWLTAEDGPHRPPGGRRPARGLVGLLVVLALLGASVAAGYLLWDRVLAPITPIPAVVGQPDVDARGALELRGFDVVVADARPHDLQTPADHVLEQAPTGEARRGTAVTLVLSAGPRPVEIPEVAGADAEAALDRLQRAGLAVTTEEQHHDEVAAGDVVAVEPGAGQVVDEGSTVTVTISLGSSRVEVPNVRRQRLDEAVATLEDLGLSVTVERRGGFTAFLRPGRVFEQEPEPGTLVDDGSTIVLHAYED